MLMENELFAESLRRFPSKTPSQALLDNVQNSLSPQETLPLLRGGKSNSFIKSFLYFPKDIFASNGFDSASFNFPNSFFSFFCP